MENQKEIIEIPACAEYAVFWSLRWGEGVDENKNKARDLLFARQGKCTHDWVYSESGEKRIFRHCNSKERQGRRDRGQWFRSTFMAPPSGYENLRIVY